VGCDFERPGGVVSGGEGAGARIGPTVLRGAPARAAKAGVGGAYLGSVGAISRATDLVREELGWPTSEAVGTEEPESDEPAVPDEPVEIRIDDDTPERE
jgi:NADH dehydrogenase